MAFVSDVNYPSSRLLQDIMEKVNAFGNQPRVIVELDKMSYVRGMRKRYDVIKFVQDEVVKNAQSIDYTTEFTDYTSGQVMSYSTELRTARMSMPILSSAVKEGNKNDSTHVNGMRITDWHDTDPRCSRKTHAGIDLDLEVGDPVYAVWDGVVTFAGLKNGYGYVVYIDHGNGWETRYAHMKQYTFVVSYGDRVHAGQLLGLGGNSGTVVTSGGGDGSHLHFEVRYNGKDVNPEPFLRGQKTIQMPYRMANVPTGGGGENTNMPYDEMADSTTTFVDLNMEATAYASSTGVTKGGTNVKTWNNFKIIAIDPAVVPLKSKVDLIVDGVNIGEYLVDDVSPDVKGKQISILMQNQTQATQYGKKNVTVRVKYWGDGKPRAADGSILNLIPAYQYNKTTTRVSYDRDFTSKKTGLDPKKFPVVSGAEQFLMNESRTLQTNVLGFRGTAAAGSVKKFEFEHDWFNNGNLGWAYIAELEMDDVVTIKVNGTIVTQVKGVNAKSGVAYPPSIPITKGNHKIEVSLANPAKASTGKFGLMFIKAREFDVETVASKIIWGYEDSMNSAKNWTEYNNVTVNDLGDYQSISSTTGEAGIERLGKISKFPFTMQFKVKVADNTSGRVYVSDGKRRFLVYVNPDGITASGGGTYINDNKADFVEYVMVCHDDTDMDVYIKTYNQLGEETWVNTGVRGVAEDYTLNRILFAVGNGEMLIDDVKYSFNDYAVEQLTANAQSIYQERWYEVGSFQYEQTFALDTDIMAWEIHSHMDMSSTTATLTLNNNTGIYSPSFERNPVFPDTYKAPPSELSYWEEGELRHVLSEGTPVRIYAGYGDEVVRVFTGMIKGEIEEDAETKVITFHCVDRFDMLEEFVFFKNMQYPPEETYMGDGGSYAWVKSSVVEDLIVQAGMTSWRFHEEDVKYPDYEIDDTVYIDVNRGKNTFMKFNKETGELETVAQDSVKTVGGWENPFVTAVTYPVGTRCSDAVRTVIQDIPYDIRCNRYGTFRMKRMTFLDMPEQDLINIKKWDFVDGENLLELTSSTDYSRVRNHLMISGSAGIVEHFFDKSLIIATKGNIRTAGINLDWLEEKDGASMRGLKEDIAKKVFFDMKRQARTKNVVVKGNPLIELLDVVYVYDGSTFTSGYYIIKGNKLVGNERGMVNFLELTWQSLPQAM